MFGPKMAKFVPKMALFWQGQQKRHVRNAPYLRLGMSDFNEKRELGLEWVSEPSNKEWAVFKVCEEYSDQKTSGASRP